METELSNAISSSGDSAERSGLQLLTLLIAGVLPLISIRSLSADINFESQIRPLLQQKCGDCHGNESPEGGLRLDVRGSFFRGGNSGSPVNLKSPTDSELLRRITSTDPDLRMPPDDPPLTDTEIRLLRNWIENGAEWPETQFDREAAVDQRLNHWAFQPIVRPSVPKIVGRPAEAIDAFVLRQLQQQNLSLSPAADSETLLRRASLILTGLLPEKSGFTEYRRSPGSEAWRTVIDELLQRPGYGERWAQHWLDIVRYADTHGFEVNTPRETAWPYRDYVIRAFNQDLPYDEFIRDQIAGDLRGEDAATGFLVCAPVLLPGQIGKDEASIRLARQDALDEIITGTGNTLLGLSIGCARCHDHKFDPVSQRDYYNFQAFFSGVRYGERTLNDAAQQRRQDEAASLQPRIAELQQLIDEYQPVAQPATIFVIDETDPEFTEKLQPENGPGKNPAGTERGQRDFPGSATQIANISGGQYTWWDNQAGQDVLAFRPRQQGSFLVWVSWGVHGSGVHTRDARVVLDQDGDLTTHDDQRELTRLDQYYPAGVTAGVTPRTPLWSGLLPVGLVSLNTKSALLIRGGDTGTGITADTIVLQAWNNTATPPQLPQLRGPVTPLLNTEKIAPVSGRFLRFAVHETIDNNKHEPCLDELEVFGPQERERNLARHPQVRVASSGNYSETGIHQLKHLNDGLYGNSHSWISSELGGGWVQLEWPEEIQIDRIRWSRDREGKFPDRLATRYSISVSKDGKTWRVVADHTDRAAPGTAWDSTAALQRRSTADRSLQNTAAVAVELNELQARQQQLMKPLMVYSGVFQQPEPTFLLRRGDPEQPGAETRALIPALFREVESSTTARQQPDLTEDQQRRLRLAEWIASPEHPLTARVMVNRIWQYHFGTGLVSSPNDFGLNGEPPSHPELLDWLAAEFVSSGWSVKHMQKLIMQSEVWQQQSLESAQGLRVDNENRLLWRFGSRRMEAEAIRDCMLQLSGTLNRQMGGSGFSFFTTRGGLNGFPPIEEFSAEGRRRMIYSHRVRMEAVPIFGAFDCPDAGQSEPSRSQSTTAIQALNLFNSRFTVQLASEMASRIQRETPDNMELQVTEIWQSALSRPPSPEEHVRAIEIAQQWGLQAVCRAVVNSHEFLVIP